jgi:hypothetical protein
MIWRMVLITRYMDNEESEEKENDVTVVMREYTTQ